MVGFIYSNYPVDEIQDFFRSHSKSVEKKNIVNYIDLLNITSNCWWWSVSQNWVDS